MSLPAKIGTWGGEGGYPQDARRFPHRLIRVRIHTIPGGEISAISFDYVSNNGEVHHEGPWGDATVGQPQVLELAASEFINGMFGTVGTYGNTSARIVASLRFVTNHGKSHQYGRDSQVARFDIPVQQGQIVGFFGRSGGRLDAIGIYVRG